MNPFVRANLKFSTPTVELLDLVPESFEGAFIGRLLLHGGEWQVDKIVEKYQRGQIVTFRDRTLMVIAALSNREATTEGHPGARVLTFRAVDLPTILNSIDPDSRPGGATITISEKIVRSVEPKFGVLAKRKLIT